MIASSALQAPVGLTLCIFVGSQLLAAADVFLFIMGRYLPQVTILAIKAEQWLGPLPWKHND